VDKKIVKRVIIRGRIGDFTVHDSTNHRFKTITYGLRRLAKIEAQLAKQLARISPRYERAIPGELVHSDNRRLPYLLGEGITKKIKREVPFVAIDDYSRYLFADILPDRTQWSAFIFGETALKRLSFPIECWYTDRGREYCGSDKKHEFVKFLKKQQIQQKTTKPKHPWTNGKAERVIKTLLNDWLKQNHFTSREERRKSLYQFVDWYNCQRPHSALKGQTPFQRLKFSYQLSEVNYLKWGQPLKNLHI